MRLKTGMVSMLVALVTTVTAWADSYSDGRYKWLYEDNHIYSVSPDPSGDLTLPPIGWDASCLAYGTCEYHSQKLNFANVTSFVIPSDEYEFLCCDQFIPSKWWKNQTGTIARIGEWAIGLKKSVTSLTIPSGIKKIASNFALGAGSFSSLASLSLPDGLTHICSQAFYFQPQLSNVTIPASVEYIGDYAFVGAKGPFYFLGDRPELTDCSGNWMDDDSVLVFRNYDDDDDDDVEVVVYFMPGTYGWVDGGYWAGARTRQLKGTIKVTFNANGGCFGQDENGSYPTSAIQHRVGGSPYRALPTPARNFYKFQGWYTSASGGTKVESFSNVPNSPHTLYAHWSEDFTTSFGTSDLEPQFYDDGFGSELMVFPVVMVPGDGSGSPYLSHTTMARTALPANRFSYAGHSFVGWKVYDACRPGPDSYKYMGCGGGYAGYYQNGAQFDFCGSTALVAQWSIDTYTVTFNANGGSVGTSSVSREYDTAVGTLPTPTRTGHTFGGWYTSASGGSQVSSSTKVTGHVTYYAHWTVNRYTATFNANGGNGGTAKTQDYGTSLTAPTVTRTGYTFTGWSPSVPATMPAMNKTYTAQWKINTYTVTFDANGGTNRTLSVSREHGTAVGILPSAPGRRYYAFIGWYTARNGGEPADENAIVTSNLTFFAQWTQQEAELIIQNGVLTKVNPGRFSSVVIPDGVTRIGSDAFSGCSGVTNVTIPDSVTDIDEGAFHGCSGLADMNGFVLVRNILHYYCGEGGDVTIPDGVTGIGKEAFSGCSELTSVTIPDGLSSIGRFAFSGCGGLTSITMPGNVPDVGEGAFGGCDGLRHVTLTRFVPATFTLGALFPDAYGLITEIVLPEGITVVGDSAFSGCSGLTSLTIPDGVTRIGNEAFSGCVGLTNITIPDSVTDIGDGAFRGCSSLAGMTIPPNVTNIGDGVFEGCSDLANVMLDRIAGKYLRMTLAELGYDVPTDGTPYSVTALGLPSGLKLRHNAAEVKKDRKGKKIIVKKAKVEWWIEGVPTAALDFLQNPPYLVITVNGKSKPLPLSMRVAAQEETAFPDVDFGWSPDGPFFLPGVTNGWSVSGLPPGLKYTAKLLTTKRKVGKKTVVITNALPYSVYGKATKAGLFTITAKKMVGGYYETMKFRMLVKPADVDKVRFGENLTNLTTMVNMPVTWNLTNDVSSVGGNVAKVTGLPAGLVFAAANVYAGKGKTQIKQAAQTIVGKPTKPGTYVVTFTKNVKRGRKTVAETAQILWDVVPNDTELSLDFNTSGGVVESGVVGLKYGDLMAFNVTSNATVTASGLPVGIKLVRLDGGLLDEQTPPGFATWGFEGVTAKTGTYLVTVKAMLDGKTAVQRLALEVKGLPSWATGTYNGYVASLDGSTNGLATVTVSSAGRVSGKFQELGTNWTFSAASYTAACPASASDQGGAYSGNGTFVCSNVVAKYAYKEKSGKRMVTKFVTRELTLTVTTSAILPHVGIATVTNAALPDETGTNPILPDVSVKAWQNLWGSDYKAVGKRIFTSKSGRKTLAYKTFTVRGTTEEGAAIGLVPEASLSLKVTTAGTVTATLTFDTGRTKKDPKTKKTVKVYYKPTCQTVVVPTATADADPFTCEAFLYFAPSPAFGFAGYVGGVGF